MKGDRVEAVVDVEHPATEGRDRAVEVSTRRRMGAGSTDE